MGLTKEKTLALIILVCVVGASLWYFTGNKPEDAIHARMDVLEDLILKESAESTIEALAKAQKISRFVTMQPYIEFADTGKVVTDHDELVGLLSSARMRGDHLSIDFGSRSITMDASGKRATMQTRIRAQADIMGDQYDGRANYRLKWVMDDGKWRIESAEVIE